ncbi:hypothetical protein LCGC14_0737760 [marine sediment metagenome]|uniref:TFIIB-type domain-containing protein n=1 Tax=marine sediment metagenome TaxID=412755 RepID=A0A0F9Q7M7_9ZZZZ
MTPKNQLQECPKCRSLKTIREEYEFRCSNCGHYFQQLRQGNEKKEVEVRR